MSREAIADPDATLRLEHHARIQTTQTQLVEAHRRVKRLNPAAFARVAVECENDHAVIFAENYAAMRHGGDYRSAGIKLVAWRRIPVAVRQVLMVPENRANSLSLNGWGGRDRTYECRNQNPVPYHLATPQRKPVSRRT